MGTINVSGLGKAYKQYPSRASRLAEWIIPWSKPRHKLKWVLEDLNFQVRSGEAVGIIGVNGAGKSTLLKMITGTTQPSVGSVEISGRVAALLELGMGFHPEFTGRQNAIMAGQLLGLSVGEVNDLLPEIEAFAEIGDYIDQPVRLYSSGMQMRLAFSVATARRPDVLIVDEALSVGDAYFQHKSFERIREFRKGGTTLLIVSHDKAAIQSICDRAILLKSGRLAMEGKPEEVMDYYNAVLAERQNQTIRQSIAEEGRIQTVSGSGEASIVDVTVLNEQGESLKVVEVGAPVTLRVRAKINKAIDKLVLGFMIKDRLGQPVFGTNTHHMRQTLSNLCGGDCVDFKFAFRANLGPGSYSVAVALTGSENHLSENYEWRDLALVFEMLNVNHDVFTGSMWLNPIVTIEKELAE